MNMKNNIYENLLDTWLRTTFVICNRRIVKELSFNEAVVCRLLNEAKQNNVNMTATDLCNKTKILKSLMNLTLNNLEKKEMIRRVRSKKDKRQYYLVLNEEHIDVYKREHKRIIGLIKEATKELNDTEIQNIIDVLGKITDSMEDYYGN